MLANCFRFAPRDSVPGLIAKICKYLKDHPGWSEDELEEQINKFISATGVESFNGRTGNVTLDKNDVNNLKIASAYFAEGDESIDSLDLVSLYNQGVRFVFTDFNSVTSGYNLAFVLDYLSASGEVVYYPMTTGSGGGGNIISVNGKTGVVELSLADIIGTSGVQVKLCTETEFTSTTTATWNAYYKEGYRIVGVVNSSATAIDYIYLLKQDENNHQPIGLSAGVSDAYTPTNPPPYPVKSVNGKTGVVTGLYDAENQPPYPVKSVNSKTGLVSVKSVDVTNGNSTDDNAYIFVDESVSYPEPATPLTFDNIYPVGSIYISINPDNPGSLFGGAWESIGGRFLLGADADYTAGSTGGEEKVTLSYEQVPSKANLYYYYEGNGTVIPSDFCYLKSDAWLYSNGNVKGYTNRFGPERNANAHNNMPPYLAVYMWKRVS